MAFSCSSLSTVRQPTCRIQQYRAPRPRCRTRKVPCKKSESQRWRNPCASPTGSRNGNPETLLNVSRYPTPTPQASVAIPGRVKREHRRVFHELGVRGPMLSHRHHGRVLAVPFKALRTAVDLEVDMVLSTCARLAGSRRTPFAPPENVNITVSPTPTPVPDGC